MHYSRTVYRPPHEASSLILQVTEGCSHNSCWFCTMYRDVEYKVESMEQIESDIKEAAWYYPRVKRVFLVNGDPFGLDTERLAEIARCIHKWLPSVETIGTYASVNNILSKSMEELHELRSLGYTGLNVGMESGDDVALKYLNKGYTAAQAEEALQRLNEADMTFCVCVIFCAGGAERAQENALASARILNAVQPEKMFVGTIHSSPGCPLYEDMRSGLFKESTIGGFLDEEITFLENLELKNCEFVGHHPANIVPLYGTLPHDREAMLGRLRDVKSRLPQRVLDSIPKRRGEEGAIIW